MFGEGNADECYSGYLESCLSDSHVCEFVNMERCTYIKEKTEKDLKFCHLSTCIDH